MKVVGDQLVIEAGKREGSPTERDLFSRSAFNRFYYAAFLETRSGLQQLGMWKSGLGHKDVPEYLCGTVVSELKSKFKPKLPPDSYYRCKTAASDLATLLRLAYRRRVIADYVPETLVEFDGGVARLEETPISDASRWCEMAGRYIQTIRKAYVEAGLV